jgi:hypothetical protein
MLASRLLHQAGFQARGNAVHFAGNSKISAVARLLQSIRDFLTFFAWLQAQAGLWLPLFNQI